MTDAPLVPVPGQSGGPPNSGPTCGNCGAAVSATDVMCPACDALLAAYQAPEGASPVPIASQPVSMSDMPPAPPVGSEHSGPAAPLAGTERVTGSGPVSPAPSPLRPSPVTHRPRSTSPIADALERIEESGSSISADAAVASSDDLASELSKMAENDSDLAKDVEARLRGAKVRFDGTSPTIETQPDPELAAPTPEVHPVGSKHTTRPPIPVLQDAARPARQRDRRPTSTRPVTITTIDEAPDPAPPEITHLARRYRLSAGKIGRAIPFVLIFLFLLLGFDRTVSIISVGVIVGLGVLIVTGLVAATSRVGRKTTSMLRDDTW